MTEEERKSWMREYQKRYREANRERAKEYQKAYRERHKYVEVEEWELYPDKKEDKHERNK